MATRLYGPLKGSLRMVLRLPVAAASADISANDVLVYASGFVSKAAAGGTVIAGVAVTAATSPSTNGGVYVEVDVSEDTLYRFQPDTGNVTDAMRGTTMDLGGAQSIDIDASAVDNVIVHDVDVANNDLTVSFKTKSAFPGVV